MTPRPTTRGGVPRRERFYAYRVTDVTGTQLGKTTPGEHILEREYKGDGEYTWIIYNFDRQGTPVSATITGRYVGKVYCEDGQLDGAARALLSAPLEGLDL